MQPHIAWCSLPLCCDLHSVKSLAMLVIDHFYGFEAQSKVINIFAHLQLAYNLIFQHEVPHLTWWLQTVCSAKCNSETRVDKDDSIGGFQSASLAGQRLFFGDAISDLSSPSLPIVWGIQFLLASTPIFDPVSRTDTLRSGTGVAEGPSRPPGAGSQREIVPLFAGGVWAACRGRWGVALRLRP
eukprot:4421850-Amphidinium_carterae.3